MRNRNFLMFLIAICLIKKIAVLIILTCRLNDISCKIFSRKKQG